MRKIIYYAATSADGYIARTDGGVEWLDRPMPKGSYGMAAFFKSVDTVLMGRETYDVGRRFGLEGHPGKKNYVFTRKRLRTRAPNVEFVRGPIGEFARRLRAERGKDVWLMGGAALAASFLDEGQLDELFIHVIPVLIGEGILLVQPRRRTTSLSLISSHSYTDGVVRLHYSVRTRE
ncbi:MAG TPA: dihydrofolate reductase family protein [Pyrinomonadaceae bacterium]|nr:dihydrofolate reductase family protein [Pyrinomonadaceae bacterium]